MRIVKFFDIRVIGEENGKKIFQDYSCISQYTKGITVGMYRMILTHSVEIHVKTRCDGIWQLAIQFSGRYWLLEFTTPVVTKLQIT